MEQAQKQQKSQANAATDAKHRLADEEAFDSVRQAALVLFKQRTKDLTQLSSVEAQSQKIEAELQQAQVSLAQLSAQQASLEALVEEEQQRVRQREGRLTELHGALVQLDEEQRMYNKLQQSAEAAIGAATMFIGRFTGAECRLFQLLTMAKERAGGRNARELQVVVTQVEQRLADVTEQHQRFLSKPFCFQSCALPSALITAADVLPAPTLTEYQHDAVKRFAAVMQGWVTQAEPWSRHRELADVLSALRLLLQWVAEGSGTDQGEAAAAAQTVSSQPASAWPPLPLCPADCLDEAVFLTLPEVGLVQLIQECVLSPLSALRTFFDRLTAASARIHFCLPAEVSACFTSLEATLAAGWMSLVAQRRQWKELVEDSAKASEQAAAAVQAECVARRELQIHAESCGRLSEAFDERKSEVETSKAVELLNYAAAWQKGWGTITAQRTSLLSLQSAAEARVQEAARTDALLKSEAEAHASEMDVRQGSVQEQQANLSAAQRQLEEASIQKAALEAEIAAMRQTEREAQQQLEKLLSCGQTPPFKREVKLPALSQGCPEPGSVLGVMESTRPSVASVVQSASACPDVYQVWATNLQAQKEGLAHTSDFVPLLNALCLTTERGDNATDSAEAQPARLVCEALQHIATTLQLPVELFQPDVLSEGLLSQLSSLTSLAAEEQSMRSSAETHRAFLAEAQAEMRLLRQELSTRA
ncbi:hypothetical protein ABL78_1984 [Leptomonas seymouri]|uniref:Uncharacterized protein n=1 Tax=Leptomonas seymouri TaxID=5684 RepID=A0A0N0P7L7_LEPSE|nr:hypothetical protein ABL78_1984 [Leptomonas seymouri]|eukprot:KPI88939.1 hypothetical protein ABL78_1984 [Leptomonas seymouri]